MQTKTIEKTINSQLEENMHSKFWTRRKIIAFTIAIVFITVFLLSQLAFYKFRLDMITCWAEKLGDEPEAIKTVIQYLMPSNHDLASTLISILGVIISVWVGLNIYNFLGKDELARLEDKEKILSASLNKRTGDLQTAIDAASQNSYDLSLATLFNFSSLNSAHYATGLYLQKHFDSWKRDGNDLKIDTAIMSAIVNIESLFLSASEANRAQRTIERITIAKTGFTACDALEVTHNSFTKYSENEKTFLDGYLRLRRGDFLFYIGHGQPWGHDSLYKAIQEFDEVTNLWFPNAEEKMTNFDEPELYCIAYLYNIIGECYNVQRQDPMNSVNPKGHTGQSLATEANNYFEKSIRCVEIAKDKFKETFPTYFSTYYRNLGTVREYLKDKNCLNSYEEALKINHTDWRSHQTIATYLLRQISDDPPRSGSIATDNIKTITDQILPHITLLMLQSPFDKAGYNLACWAYTLMAMAYRWLNKTNNYKECFDLAEHFLRIAEGFPSNASACKCNRDRIQKAE